MKKISSTIIFLWAIFSSITSIQAQDCNCVDAFETTVETYEKNYSLFRYKVTDDNLAIYNAFTEVMREKAAQKKVNKECKKVLDQWLGFFRDRHNWIILLNKDDQEIENISVSEDTIDEDQRLFNTFHIRVIDDVPYIRFPNFTVDPQEVHKAISANHELFVNADFIVVDLRDNGGGSDYAYFPILPYILDGPIQMPHVGMWMSEDNLQPYLEDQGGKGKKPEDRTPKEKENYDWLMSYKDSLFYQKPGEYAYTYATDTIYTGPKKVAVLMNENSGSSAETFIFRAKQSDRVIFYGQNSAGAVDGFMVFSKNIGCFELSYPHAVRAPDVSDNPIDPYGMEPDVYLDKNVDALDFSLKHMKQLLKNQETYLNNSSN